jgi:Glycosyltransferase family 87
VGLAAGSTRLSPIARRLCIGILAVSAAFGALVFLILVPGDSGLNEKDFGQEYLLARATLDRIDPYQPIRELGARYVSASGYFDKPYPTPHPPTVALMALPLGLLGYSSAVRIWFGFELVCLLASVALLIQGAGLPIPLRMVAVIAVALVAWPPMTLELGLGQLTLPVLLGLAGAQVALLARRSVLGGGLLSVTLLIKPIAWPWLIVLAWRREWRALAAAGGVILAGAVLSVLTIGLAPVLEYLTRILPAAASAFALAPTNMSPWTVAPRLGSSALSALLPCAFALLAVWWSCQRRPLAVSLAMLTIASLLVNPIVWYFYFVLALLPLAHVCAALWKRGLRRAEVIVALGVFGLLSVSQSKLIELGRGGVGTGVLLEPALGLLLLACLVAWLSASGTQKPGVPRPTT